MSNRYASWPLERLYLAIRIYDRPLMRILFQRELAGCAQELLDRALPDYAEECGGHLVSAPPGGQ